MTTLDAVPADILAQPADGTSRLVYADLPALLPVHS
jgi:hypothetical protein